MLRKVGAEFVKIDRSIVAAAAADPNARAVLMAMATYARQTGSFVIAEGIEDQETLDFLRHVDKKRRAARQHESRAGRVTGSEDARPATLPAPCDPPGYAASPAAP